MSYNRQFIQPTKITNPIKKLNWFATLATKKLHFKKPLSKNNVLNIILLDTSASTIGQSSLATAKGVALNIANQSYLKRQSLCVITFGCERVDVVLTPQRTPKNIKPLLESIKAGGGTPLRKALLQTTALIDKQSAHYESCKLYLFTDGRSRDDLTNIYLPCETLLVDTESGAIKLGKGKSVANILNAQYTQIEQIY